MIRHIPGIKQKIRSVSFFNKGTVIKYKQQDEGICVYLDDIKIDELDTIIQLQMQ